MIFRPQYSLTSQLTTVTLWLVKCSLLFYVNFKVPEIEYICAGRDVTQIETERKYN